MKNWRTTLLGVLAAMAMIFGQYAGNRAVDKTAPPITAGNVLPAILVGAVGALAKDAANNEGK